MDHDPHFFPLGKTRSARVEDDGDISKLIAVADETRSETTAFHKSTGDNVVTVAFPNDDRRFFRQSPDDDGVPVQFFVDPANFSSMDECLAVLDGEEAGDTTEAKLMVRRSFIPEPLIEIAVNYPLLAWLLVWGAEQGRKALTYTIDQTQKRAGDALANALSTKIKKAIAKWNEHRLQDDREPTAQVIIHAEPQIHLLTRNADLERDFDIGLESLCRTTRGQE